MNVTAAQADELRAWFDRHTDEMVDDAFARLGQSDPQLKELIAAANPSQPYATNDEVVGSLIAPHERKYLYELGEGEIRLGDGRIISAELADAYLQSFESWPEPGPSGVVAQEMVDNIMRSTKPADAITNADVYGMNPDTDEGAAP